MSGEEPLISVPLEGTFNQINLAGTSYLSGELQTAVDYPLSRKPELPVDQTIGIPEEQPEVFWAEIDARANATIKQGEGHQDALLCGMLRDNICMNCGKLRESCKFICRCIETL